MFSAVVILNENDGWFGADKKNEIWNAPTKEELFMKILKANTHNLNQHSTTNWKLQDYNLCDEYDQWFYNLPSEVKFEISQTA